MSTIKRNVGEPLRLRLSLGDNNTSKFVKAFLSSDGAPLLVPTATLAHFGQGIYGNNSYLMPASFAVIDIKYIIYLDAGFTVEDPTYFSATDQYEIDDFDSTNFLPPFPQQVFAQVENGRVDVQVKPPSLIGAVMGAQSSIEAIVERPSAIQVQIKQENEIEGVLND